MGMGTWGMPDPQQKKTGQDSRLALSIPVLFLIFKRTFLRLKKDLSFNFGGWAPVLEQINDLSP